MIALKFTFIMTTCYYINKLYIQMCLIRLILVIVINFYMFIQKYTIKVLFKDY